MNAQDVIAGCGLYAIAGTVAGGIVAIALDGSLPEMIAAGVLWPVLFVAVVVRGVNRLMKR